MNRPRDRKKTEIRRRPGWLVPAALLLAVILPATLLLGWYLRPGLRAAAALTGGSDPVRVRMAGLELTVPANYLRTKTARAGGEQNSLSLTALFPSWEGYSPDAPRLFQANTPETAIIHIALRQGGHGMGAATRLTRIYGPHLAAPDGVVGLYGLLQYRFAANSSYDKNDLFVGGGGNGLVLFLCERAAATPASPSCLATDRPLMNGVSYSFRFKRAYLPRWREISDGVDALIVRFVKN